MVTGLQYSNFSSRCSVKIKTWRGEEYDLTGDIVEWHTSKSLTKAAGQFSIAAVPRQHASKNWAQLVQPMDYVEIRASETGDTTDGEYPIIMRGFVNFAGESFAIGSTGGPQEPRILITGTDYGKLFEMWQVLYLWTQNGAKEQALGQHGLGLFYNYDIPSGSESATNFFRDVFNKMMLPVVKGIQEKWMQIPNLEENFDLPDFQMGITTEIRNFTGSFWNLFSYFISPPFGEVFIWDAPTRPIFTARMTPYRTLDGKTPRPGQRLDIGITTSQGEISQYNLGITDNDVFTYYLTYATGMSQSQNSGALFSVAPDNGVQTSNMSLYGTRPLLVDTSWIDTYEAGKSNMLNVGNELNKWLMDVTKDNMHFRQGTMTMKGRSRYRIGQYMKVEEWNEEFYIASVDHSFINYQEWQVNTQLTRGRKLS